LDFFIPKARLVVEVDGSQHSEIDSAEKDRKRAAYMNTFGIQVLRFNNIEVLKETDAVVDIIARRISDRLGCCADSIKH